MNPNKEAKSLTFLEGFRSQPSIYIYTYVYIYIYVHTRMLPVTYLKFGPKLAI